MNNKWTEEQIFTVDGSNYGTAYRFTKSKIRVGRRKFNFFFLIILIMSIGILFSLGGVIFNVASTFKFGGGKDEVGLAKRTYYALNVESFISEDLAVLKSSEIKKLGGAGYILNQDNTYSVLAFVYSSKEDAEKVAQKMTSYSPKIIELNCKSINFNTEFEANQEVVLQNALNSFDALYKQIFSFSNSYDQKEMNINAVREKLIEMQTKFNNMYSVFKDVFFLSADSNIKKVDLSLQDVQAVLNNLVDPIIDVENFNSTLKTSAIKIILARQSMN